VHGGRLEGDGWADIVVVVIVVAFAIAIALPLSPSYII